MEIVKLPSEEGSFFMPPIGSFLTETTYAGTRHPAGFVPKGSITHEMK